MPTITVHISQEDWDTLSKTPNGIGYHVHLGIKKQARHIRKRTLMSQPAAVKSENVAVNRFLARWCDVWGEYHKNEKYVVKPQDVGTARSLLNHDRVELRKRIDRYLANEWYARIGHPLWKFDWNAYSDEVWENRGKILSLPQKKRVSALALAMNG